MADNNDTFAAIAAQEVVYRDAVLVEPKPEPLAARDLPVGEPTAETMFVPTTKLSDEEGLRAELEVWRERYAPFMQKLSPPIRATRTTLPLTRFDWRVQTDTDKHHFAGVLEGEGDWESVSIPHYGPPLGRATTYYRTQIEISAEQLSMGSVFACFRGVDYKAHVFFNGSYVGSHEGFFAPFEFECGAHAVEGINTLVVRVENDYILGGNRSWGEALAGEKIYAATGLGYNDPEIGWHHCPPGMGIYQDVCLEFRSRCFVSDLYVRPLPAEERAEIWFEVFQCDPQPQEMEFFISVFGRNFAATVVEDLSYRPEIIHECGVGDALQIALAKAAGTYHKPTPLRVGPGVNRYRLSIGMEGFRWWSPSTPWLYQVQVRVANAAGEIVDAAEGHFGMRSFRMDEESEVKGRLFLNERPIRLRGANTMGHEQQCVFKKDFDQLRDDILLARICNMNFLRLTQRPVQPEVYDYCDMLGLMTQSDLPTFAVIRRSQYVEALRQVGELERLVRSHPCNIMVSYINEPVNNSSNEPHRHLSRDEMEEFFESSDRIVRRLNPERVIKACDGDYDPPSPGIQDRHCYSTWYNGQGVDIGRLHKGYWQPTKPGWYYGCGEFGAEGLERVELMRQAYPVSWLPDPGSDETQWTPSRIRSAQTGRFHYFYFETPESLAEWVEESQRYQASAMRMMAEAFRRDNRMVTFAIHLFIDAFPSGWMKTIMDCERRPKPAYFAYRDALAPLLPNLRTDRSRFYSGETISLESWVCNDLTEAPAGLELRYSFVHAGEAIAAGSAPAVVKPSAAVFQGRITTAAPEVTTREVVTARLAAVSPSGEVLNDTSLEVEVFPRVPGRYTVTAVGAPDGPALRLATEMGAVLTDDAPVILVDDMIAFAAEKASILGRALRGARVVLLDLAPGSYDIAGRRATVKASGFNPLHFASRRTGHWLVEGFAPHDFRHWYDPEAGYITPIIKNTLACGEASPVLLSGNTDESGEWTRALAAAEITHGLGSIVVCQVELAGRTSTNPPARIFAHRLLSPPTKAGAGSGLSAGGGR